MALACAPAPAAARHVATTPGRSTSTRSAQAAQLNRPLLSVDPSTPMRLVGTAAGLRRCLLRRIRLHEQRRQLFGQREHLRRSSGAAGTGSDTGQGQQLTGLRDRRRLVRHLHGRPPFRRRSGPNGAARLRASRRIAFDSHGSSGASRRRGDFGTPGLYKINTTTGAATVPGGDRRRRRRSHPSTAWSACSSPATARLRRHGAPPGREHRRRQARNDQHDNRSLRRSSAHFGSRRRQPWPTAWRPDRHPVFCTVHREQGLRAERPRFRDRQRQLHQRRR